MADASEMHQLFAELKDSLRKEFKGLKEELKELSAISERLCNK